MESNIVKEFIDKINSSNIKYCHFKSNSSLSLSMKGDTDLDLLFESGSETAVASIMKSIECILFDSLPDRSYDDVYDYIAYDGDIRKPIHFHCHFRLDIGEKWVKSYRLPWQDLILDGRQTDPITKIATSSPEWELILLILRQTTRIYSTDIFSSKLPSISAKAKSEFVWLTQKIDSLTLEQIMNNYLSQGLRSSIIEIIESGYSSESFHSIRRQVLSDLSKYRKYTHLLAIRKFYIRKASHYLKRFYFIEKYFPGKRTLIGDGFTVAIVGTDGSGKTTICKKLVASLLQKVSIKYVYLGHGKSGAGPIFLFALKSLSYLNRRVSSRLKLFGHLANLLILYRRWYILNLVKHYISQGRIVCMDRFPQFNKPGVSDGSFFSDHRRLWWSIPYTLEIKVKQFAEQVNLDYVVHLHADTKVLKSRLLNEYNASILDQKDEAINDFMQHLTSPNVKLDTGELDPNNLIGVITPKFFKLVGKRDN
jgi:hypothetical protein